MINISCPVCQGVRPFCIHKSYPIERPKEIEKKVKGRLKKSFFGPSYSVFVGQFGYPQIDMGPMTGLEENQNMDNPANWFGMDYQQIIELRSMLIRSKQPENVFSKTKFVQENQELAIASKPADVEIVFKKDPVFNFTLSDYLQPMGPVGILEKLRITENTKIERKVEYIVKDDLKAAEASYLLYQNNQDVYKITTILSSGILGKAENKKLVPTRWSITATDDIIGKNLIEKIKDCRQISEHMIFESNYMDNHFIVSLIPGSWEFENFEVWTTQTQSASTHPWAPGISWSAQTQSMIIEEYEPYEGRKDYADKQAGGYYATRLAILEYLEKINRQAKVIVFREVGQGYTIPLGVWQVRENVRNAVRQEPNKFSVEKDSIDFLKKLLRVGFDDYAKNSKILRRRTVADFFRKV